MGADVAKSLVKATKNPEARELIVQGIDEGLGAPGSGPNSYKRRGRNGGLTDPNLIAVDLNPVQKEESGGYIFSVFIKSTAEGNENYRGGTNPFYKESPDDWLPTAQDRFYVGSIVQTGFGYSWKNSRYYNPYQLPGNGRPIYNKAGEKLSANGQLASMISADLARRGW